MWTYIAIAIGGTLGCWARYAQTVFVQATFGRDFPYATLSINVIGSFLMGFLFILTLERLMIPPSVRVGILTGVLGGYTTFSSFGWETAKMMEDGEWLRASTYVAASVVAGLFLSVAGIRLANKF